MCHLTTTKCTKTLNEQILYFHQIFLLKITSILHSVFLIFSNRFKYFIYHQNLIYSFLINLNYLIEYFDCLKYLVLPLKNEISMCRAMVYRTLLPLDYIDKFYQAH